MKKTSLVSSLILAGLAVSLTAPVALADVVGTFTDGKATVNFSEGKDVKPTDPITPPVVPPVGPTDPEEPGHGGNTGKLILSVPNELKFGEHAISDKDATVNPGLTKYKSTNDSAEYLLPPMFVVKDVRGKEDGAWNLSVALSEFQNVAGTKKLAGATISFLKGGNAFNSGIKAEDEAKDVDLLIKEDNPNFNISRGGFTLNDSPQMLMSSQNGAGRGETTFVADNRYTVNAIEDETYKDEKVDNGIALDIPATADKEVGVGYQAMFTWTISDTME